jgi:hypothetical protein
VVGDENIFGRDVFKDGPPSINKEADWGGTNSSVVILGLVPRI